MHACKSGMVHCHLSSRNIFIEPVVVDHKIEYKVKLGDLGELSIRQSATVFLGHDIRNTWSSPEVLNDPNLIFQAKRISLDIYSFGMLLWELFSNTIPFADNIEAAKTFVADKNFRPKIRYQHDEIDKDSATSVNKGKFTKSLIIFNL